MEAQLAIEARLRECAEFQYVGSALQLAAVTGKPPAQPLMLYVVPVNSLPSANKRSTGTLLQRVAETYGVVMAIKAVNDPHGALSAERLVEALRALRKALHGWSPLQGYDPLELAGGNVIAMQPGAMFWLEKFSTAHHEESAHG